MEDEQQLTVDEPMVLEAEHTMKTKLIEVFRDNISGVQYGDYQKITDKLKPGAKLQLFWERRNSYDTRAIRIELGGVKLGYVKGKGSLHQTLLHQYREQEIKVVATLVSYNKNNPSWQALVYKIEAPSMIGVNQEERLTK